MTSLGLTLTYEDRIPLAESRNLREYIETHKEIIREKARQPELGLLEEKIYLIDIGVLIRSCQMVQKPDTCSVGIVDPAFIRVCIPQSWETAAGGRWCRIASTLLKRPDIFVVVDEVKPYPKKDPEMFRWVRTRWVSAEPTPDFILPQPNSRPYDVNLPVNPNWNTLEKRWCSCGDIAEAEEPEWFMNMKRTYITIAKTQGILSERQDLWKVLEFCINGGIGRPISSNISGAPVKPVHSSGEKARASTKDLIRAQLKSQGTITNTITTADRGMRRRRLSGHRGSYPEAGSQCTFHPRSCVQTRK